MVEQVCGACLGDNPECRVCGGSGVDRPDAPPHLSTVNVNTYVENDPLAPIERALQRVEDLFTLTSQDLDRRMRSVTLGLKAWFYGAVLAGGVVMLVGIYVAFLVGYYEVFVVPGMALLTGLVVGGALTIAYRVSNFNAEDFADDEVPLSEDA